MSKALFDKHLQSSGISNENVEQKTDTIFISINDSCGTKEVPYLENKKNVKVLFFDDVEKDMEVPNVATGGIYHIKAFTTEQANEILDFLEKNKDCSDCIVHCTAGISRSGAVGEFVSHWSGEKYHDFQKTNPLVLPNGLVVRLLKSAHRDRWDAKKK